MHINDNKRDTNVIEKEFNKAASTYETNRLSSWYKAHGEKIMSVLNSTKGGVFLDIGCGTGWLLRQFLKIHPEIEGIGIDISGNMIRVANEKALNNHIKNLTFIKDNWEKIDIAAIMNNLRQKEISMIVCASTFHYFNDPRMAIRKVFEILVPGGQFILLERAKEMSILTWFWDILHRFLIRDHVHFYKSFELLRLLQEIGFCDVEVKLKIKKFFWKGKFNTSLVLISGEKP